MGASALTSRATLRLASGVWLTTALATAIVGGLTALAAQNWAQRALALTFPDRTRLADLGVVLLHDGALAGALLLAARRPSWFVDVALATIWLANVALAGIALGGYGSRLLAHAAAYAAAELAACSVPIAVYVNARAKLSAPSIRDAAVTAALVVAAATLETVLPVHL